MTNNILQENKRKIREMMDFYGIDWTNGSVGSNTYLKSSDDRN